ncbi:hypothetical protein M069_1835, partial [Bacteroides fragilis str. B1 (UDC16-1)]
MTTFYRRAVPPRCPSSSQGRETSPSRAAISSLCSSIWSSSSRMINPEMLPQPAALTSMAIRRCSLPSIYAVFHSTDLGAGTRNLLLYSSGAVTFPARTCLSCPGIPTAGSGDGETGADRRFPVSPTLSRTISESRFFSFSES